LQSPDLAIDFVFGVLADGAGVDEDEIRFFKGRGFREARPFSRKPAKISSSRILAWQP
jgi:hypothetical protein